MMKRFPLQLSVLALSLGLSALTTFAQSPNTASMNVTVVDQNGAIVRGANVSVVNTATGATREAVSGEEGTATIAALPLTGKYKVTVTMTGFTAQAVSGLELRAGETATVKVKLVASGGQSEVTVYGTTEGVRTSPQIGVPLRSEQINETPMLGRKTSTLPLLNSAFRQGKGTGDLFVNQTYFITGVGSRRATTFPPDGPSNDAGLARPD